MGLHYLVTPLLNGITNSPCVSPAMGGHPATGHRALLLLFMVYYYAFTISITTCYLLITN